jgi:ribulose kinase
MLPDMWLNEGGQSAAGAAIDHLLTLHPAHAEAAALAGAEGLPLAVWLANRAMTANLSDAALLATGLHVVPEFLGNRAPFANPHARGLIAGIGMGRDMDSLMALYMAGLCGLGYGLRQIINTQVAHGAPIQRILISGGAGSHDLVRQILADATGLPVVSTKAAEPVLLGSAILGAVAGGHYDDIPKAMAGMSQAQDTFAPVTGDLRSLHSRAFAAFELLQKASHAVL